MKLHHLLTETQSPGVVRLRTVARNQPIEVFLDNTVGELLNVHLDTNKRPPKLVHDYLNPNTLDPSEWDDWDDRFMSDSAEKIASLVISYQQKKPVPPVLIRGTPADSQYSPQVLDGHHRTAAAIDAKYPVPVIYDIDTLVELWKTVNRSPLSVSQLIKQYYQYLRNPVDVPKDHQDSKQN